MSAKIIEGIVIKVSDYRDSDLIVRMITNDRIINFVALGTRKVTSKNRFALQVGNIIETEIFLSSRTDKMSKLKKATLIHQPTINKNDVAEVIFEINRFLVNLESISKELYSFLKKGIKLLGQEFNHQIKTFIVAKTLKDRGLNVNFNYCVECGNNNNINNFHFYKGGFLCTRHSITDQSLELLKSYKNLDGKLEGYLATKPTINKIIYSELVQFITQSEFI